MENQINSVDASSGNGLIGKLAQFAMHIAAGLLFITMLAIVVNAGIRYTVGGGVHMILELSGFIFMWLIFLGLAGTYLVGGHVTVEALLSQVSPRARSVMEGLIVPVVAGGYTLVIGIAGATVTHQLFAEGTLTDGVIPLLLWPVMIIMPIGCALLLLALLKVIHKGQWRQVEDKG